MTNIKLTHRQQQIADNIPQCTSLADVGCDHGYVGVYALHSGTTSRLYMCDISAPSLLKATRLADSYHLDNVSSHCQYGLADINCQCAVIAGMGGQEIMSIIDNATHKPQQLVLQPMRNQYLVRQYLLSHGYEIIRDYIVYDGKYYDIIVAEQGVPTELDTIQLTLGKSNLQCPTVDFRQYLVQEIAKCDSILQHTIVPDKLQRRALLVEAQQKIGGQYE